MHIYVKRVSGLFSSTLEVESSYTLDNVKKQLEDKFGIPRDVQKFIFDGQTLRNGTRTLADYGIEDESTLWLVLLKRGGGGEATPFVDLENKDALQRIAFTYGQGQSWCIVTSGLNIEGKCTRRSCTAYAKRVICRKGFCASDITTVRSTCPECKRTIKASTCGFTDCEWMYSGRKRGFAVEIKSEWQGAGDEYERFGETGNLADWEVLIITARPNPSPRPDCDMCMYKILWGEDHRSLECGCRFHRACVTKWKVRETHCPTCRVEICSPNISTEGREVTPDDMSLEPPGAVEKRSRFRRLLIRLNLISTEDREDTAEDMSLEPPGAAKTRSCFRRLLIRLNLISTQDKEGTSDDMSFEPPGAVKKRSRFWRPFLKRRGPTLRYD